MGTQTVWELVQSDGYTFDYDSWGENANGYELFIRLTLIPEKQVAYVSVGITHENGDVGGMGTLKVPYADAVRMAGFTA